MLLGPLWHRGTWFSAEMDLGELRRVSWDANCWNVQDVGTMIGPDGYLHCWTAHRKNSFNAWWKSMPLPKAWCRDCATSRFTRFLCWVLLDLYMHQKRQLSRPRTMLFSVPQQDRTTLFHLHFLGLGPFVALVLNWRAFIPSSLRLGQELLHARISCSSVAFGTGDAFDIVCRLDRDDTLDEVPQTKRRLPLVWTNFIDQTLLGLSLVVPREPWDRSVVIVLLTSCPTWKLFRVLLILDYSLVSFASYVMCSALHRDFTSRWMRCDFTVSPSKLISRSSSRFIWCPNTLQHSRNDCHDWSIVLLWSSRPSGPGWAVVYLLWFSACCWYLLGHGPGSYACAVCTRMSTVHDFSLNANFGSPCNTCTVTAEIWVMNVLTMPLHWRL